MGDFLASNVWLLEAIHKKKLWRSMDVPLFFLRCSQFHSKSSHSLHFIFISFQSISVQFRSFQFSSRHFISVLLNSSHFTSSHFLYSLQLISFRFVFFHVILFPFISFNSLSFHSLSFHFPSACNCNSLLLMAKKKDYVYRWIFMMDGVLSISKLQ